jgi:hypothetical protein
LPVPLFGAHGEAFFCGDDLALSEVDFTNSGGQDSSVNAAENLAKLKAEGGAFGAENSSNAEIGFRFTSTTSGEVTASFAGILAVGRLHGTSNVNAGSINVAAKIRDLTTDTEVASVEAIDISENGTAGGPTTQPVNTIPFAPVELDVALAADHEYAAFIRVVATANGLFGESDFKDGDRRVELGGVTLTADFVDSDGDGLPDHWETGGFDSDCDPDNGVDVDLVAMGANPNHKDLFLEIDWMPGAEPTRGMVEALKDAFALAPKDAAGTENPDDALGITVHVDAGSLVDPAAPEDPEDGWINNSCSDGVDNGADGLTDAADPDCLVGDVVFSSLGENIGRGTQVAVANITDLSTDQDGDGVVEFYETRNDNFDPVRRKIFRYVMSAPRKGSLLGEAELGGNDVLILKASEVQGCNAPSGGAFPSGTFALTLMHELGHALGLQHSGDSENPNREPNFVSIVNYAYGFGIKQNNVATSSDLDGDNVKDCRIMDYSPPVVPGGRVSAPVPQPSGILDETNLDETKRVDPSDQANRLTFFDQTAGQWVDTRIDTKANWDGDGAPNEMGVQSDINNDSATTQLTGFNDWDAIVLSQLDFEDSEDGPLSNLASSIQIDDGDEMLEIYRQTLATDFAVEKTLLSEFVVAGQSLDYAVTVTNNGPNRGTFALTDTFPTEAVLLSAEPGCALSGANEIACDPVMLEAGEEREFSLNLRLAADLACDGAQFLQIVNEATVANVTGEDTKPENNRAAVRSQALCIAYEYAAKFTCGMQAAEPAAPLGSGHYATAINIHNPNDERAHFFKKLAVAYPPAAQKPGAVIPLAVDVLEYDEALKSDCVEILRKIGEAAGTPVPFAEGFLVVQSPRSLDVSVVYTVTTPQTDVEVVEVKERKRTKTEREPVPDEKPDLTPIKFSCVPPAAGQGNQPKELRLFVRNLGPGPAPASTTVTVFAGGGAPVNTATPAIASGDTVEIGVAIPRQCPPACTFDAKADGPEAIDETNENNNKIAGECLPLPG